MSSVLEGEDKEMGELKDTNEEVHEIIAERESQDVHIIVTAESTTIQDEGPKENQGTNDRHVVLAPARRIRMDPNLISNASRPGDSNRGTLQLIESR
jgi:hypothetical protein